MKVKIVPKKILHIFKKRTLMELFKEYIVHLTVDTGYIQGLAYVYFWKPWIRVLFQMCLTNKITEFLYTKG